MFEVTSRRVGHRELARRVRAWERRHGVRLASPPRVCENVRQRLAGRTTAKLRADVAADPWNHREG